MHRARPVAIAMTGVALAVGGGTGCFAPQFDSCAVTCGAVNECPAGYFCLADGMCHGALDDQLCSAGGAADGSVRGEDAGPRPGEGRRPDGGAPVDSGVVAVRPMVGDLVISEIHKNPIAAEDPAGEWFEVSNLTDSTLDLFGLQVSDNAASFLVEASLLVEPAGSVIFGFLADPNANGDVTVDYEYGGAAMSLQLANVGVEQIVLTDPNRPDVPYDSVVFNDTEYPSTEGASMSLDPNHFGPLANDLPVSWCDGQPPPFNSGGDLGTPGEPNPQCP